MLDLLKELCNSAGVNGTAETIQVLKHALSVLVPEVYTDALGNVWGTLPAATPDAPTLLLEAHHDEIGFVVTDVTSDGFLRVAACGGVDERTLSGAQVVVLTEPPINGVFSSVPPHLAGDSKETPVLDKRVIDVALSGEEAKARIPLGTRVMFAPRFDRLLGDRVCAKALDDRAGCAAVLQAMKLLQGKSLPWNVTALFCSQEELGTRGAMPATTAIRPNAAIVTDVSFAHTPDANRRDCGVLGDGAMLGISTILNESMTEQLRALAERSKLPLQYEPMASATGTDADKITITAEGVPTALLSIPLRYMHTPIEVASLDDIESVARLMAVFAECGEVPTV